MANAAVWIVLVGLALPLYAYLVYPVALFILAAIVQTARDARFLLHRQDRRRASRALPFVSIVIAAYNEEEVIGRTIAHCLALDYPPESLEIIIGSDGSTDATVEIAQRYEGDRVHVHAFTQRRGKMAVVKDCVSRASGDVLVLTDANTCLDFSSVRYLVRHFENPRVGAVCGELRLLTPEGVPADEGLYWRYEVILKFLESRLDSVLGANGGIYALRREMFPDVPDSLITDDFVVPMKVRAAGYRVVYDPEAVASEPAPTGVSDEFRRRVRIGAGNWQALRQCAPLLLPWKGFVSFAFWSHKILRWATPFLLALAFLANLALLSHPVGRAVFVAQVAFYACAGLGHFLMRMRLPAGPLRIVAYFLTINVAIAVGCIRGMLGRQRPAWQRTARGPAVTQEKP